MITKGQEISGGGTNHHKSDAYQAKKTDRKNNHPTVKPIKLTEYLSKLMLPPIEDSSILIPFSGSGSEAIGAMLVGWGNITGLEIDENYCNIANNRVEYWKQFDNYNSAMKK